MTTTTTTSSKTVTTSTSSSAKTTATVSVVSYPKSISEEWDPLRLPSAALPQRCTMRILRDLEEIRREPPPGMVVVPDEEDVGRIHALITGPFDTPYEGGFFHFLVRCTPDYPLKPPKARLLTTGNGSMFYDFCSLMYLRTSYVSYLTSIYVH